MNTSIKVIKAKHGLNAIDFKELWQYRELFWLLALRDVLVRYKQTAIGILWAIIQPVMTVIIFSLIFGGLAKLPSEGVPYPLFTFAAILPWQFFANALNQSGNSLISNSGLISKIYFPRIIIPASAVISGVIDFCISFIVFIGLMFWYGIVPSMNIFFLPFFLLLAFLTAFAIGLWFSALNVEYRDVKYVIPFLVQAGQYMSPVAYASSIVPQKWQLLYLLNPMAGVINGFRWCILGTTAPAWDSILVNSCMVLLILIGGLYYFRKMEKTFADII